MKRTSFLTRSLGAAALSGGMPLAFMRAAGAQSGSAADPGNVLVIVQMSGGNDGLNTVVPYSDDAYHRVRPTIGVAPKTVVRINDRIAWNPALTGFDELFKEGRLALLQAVGYPDANLSHFEATEIWETASPVRPQQYGWLGRYLDRRYPQGTAQPSPFETVALGDTLPAALVSAHVDVPAIGALGAFAYNTGRDAASKASAGVLYDGTKSGTSPYLAMIADTARQAYHGGDMLRAKIAGYTSAVTYPADGFSQQLKLAAQLIGTNTGTKIVLRVSLGSFDTHAGQRAQQDRLLGYLGKGLLAFYNDLKAHGNERRVLTMTFSEFGRRVEQNSSNGTTTAPQCRSSSPAARCTAASTAITPRSPTSIATATRVRHRFPFGLRNGHSTLARHGFRPHPRRSIRAARICLTPKGAHRPLSGEWLVVLRIVQLSTEEYVRDVLPHSAEIWSGGLSFADYAADFGAVSASGFGRRRFRTLGLSVDGDVVSSCKRYQRELRCGERTFRAAGIGAVFTPQTARGRGYATAFLGALLDAERAAGTDFAYLFSDIQPAFYERLGFIRLPARAIVLRADTLPHARIPARTLGDADWPAIERCFAALDATRTFALTRPPLVWEWLRLRTRTPQAERDVVRLGIMRGRRLVAYVLGRRYPAVDAFALDEFAYVDDEAGRNVPALIRNAAGDLRKVTGWLPPAPARSVVPRGAVRPRKTGITMIVPLSAGARAAWDRCAGEVTSGPADPCWNADHV